MFPSSIPSVGRPPGQPLSGSEPAQSGGTFRGQSHVDGRHAEPALDPMHPCAALALLQPPLAAEPVLSRIPLDAPDPASHVDAALSLLRRRTGVPLAERVATGLASDRAAAIALLDALLAEGKPAGPLASSSPLAASEWGSSAIAQAHALRDRLRSGTSADTDVPMLQHAVEALIGALEATPCGREHAAIRERADAALRAIVGGPPWDLVAMINSDRLPDRQAAVHQVDRLLAHLHGLARTCGPASAADPFPPALRAAICRLARDGGHGLSPAQRTALRQCPGLGPELTPVLHAGSTLSNVAANTLGRLCLHARHCAADARRHADDAVLLAELAALGASARKLADSAPPAGGAPARQASEAAREGLLQDALSTRLSAWKPGDIASLHRWITTPALLALRTMVDRAARANPPQDNPPQDEGTSRGASALAAQRRLLRDWIAAYDGLAGLLTMRMSTQAQSATKRKAAASPVSGQAAEVATANDLFRQLFAIDPVSDAGTALQLDRVRA